MSARRQLALWVGAALAAIMLFAIILTGQRESNQRRWATVVPSHPAEGQELFREKGCAKCHGENAEGGRLGPSLRQRGSLTSLPRLVATMWNHAPHMYEAISSARLPYPAITYDEAGQLVGYLYLVGFADEPGNAEPGRRVFNEKGCARCHSVDGGSKKGAPSIEKLARADNPIAWTQVLWNHASGMERSMARAGVRWPSFNDNELRDLFAYVSSAAGRTGQSFTVPIGDAARGWQIYQSKSCLQCHALKQRGGPAAAQPSHVTGPDLGNVRSLPPTLSQFGQTMLNHFPAMHRAIGTRDGTAPPTFAAQEMADLTVFLYSLHYAEPAGSPHIGETAFGWRGCADCHGAQAQGTRRGPALRGKGQNYTSVRMAAALWAHGLNMYEQTRQHGHGWPLLQESDIGDLLAFLNTPLDSAGVSSARADAVGGSSPQSAR